MADKKVYRNKNGNMSIVEFLRLISDEEKYDKFLRGFRTTENKCPPIELIDSNQICFYCIDCHKYCRSQVKENKNEYVVQKKKYPKSELKEELDG